MDLANATPYPHLPALLYDQRGRELLVVVVKACFRLSDGAPSPAPLPIHPADVLSASGEVRYPADLVPAKIGTDVVCNGYVYAPRDEPCRRCDAELRVGNVVRRVTATGPRSEPDAEPALFERVPLGVAHAPGLSALGPGSEQRRRYMGTFDDAWQRERAPLLPEDMDARFWNAAELSCASGLVGGEAITLVSLSRGGRIETVLPRVPLRARIDDQDTRPALDLVVLEPEEDRIALTFRFAVDVTGRLDTAMPKVRIVEKRRAPFGRRSST